MSHPRHSQGNAQARPVPCHFHDALRRAIRSTPCPSSEEAMVDPDKPDRFPSPTLEADLSVARVTRGVAYATGKRLSCRARHDRLARPSRPPRGPPPCRPPRPAPPSSLVDRLNVQDRTRPHPTPTWFAFPAAATEAVADENVASIIEVLQDQLKLAREASCALGRGWSRSPTTAAPSARNGPAPTATWRASSASSPSCPTT